jgi:hypothetical protein
VLYNGTVTLNPNTPTVPTGLYNVVAQLHPDDLLVEDDEANNEAIYNQKITVVNGCGGCASGGATRGWALVAGGIGLLRRARRSR